MIGLSFVVVFAIVNYKQKQKRFLWEKKAIEQEHEKRMLLLRMKVQEDTLKVMSTELHDNICQLLGSAKVLFGQVKREQNTLPPSFTTATNTLNEALTEIRTLAKTLNKNWLNQFDLIENVKREVARLEVLGNLKTTISVSGTVEGIDGEAQLMLFRIVQEALQNSLKHGQPTLISVSIEINKSLQIIITDDGKGFVQEGKGKSEGTGLMNMQERIQLLGGDIRWHSVVGTGTNVVIQMPIQESLISY